MLGCGDCSHSIDLSWSYSNSAMQVELSLAAFMEKDLFPHESGTHKEWEKQETGMVFTQADCMLRHAVKI